MAGLSWASPLQGAGKRARDTLMATGSPVHGPKEANPTSSLLRGTLPANDSRLRMSTLPLGYKQQGVCQFSARFGGRAATLHQRCQWAWWSEDVRAWVRSGAAGRGWAGTGCLTERGRRVPHLFNSCKNCKELVSLLSEPRDLVVPPATLGHVSSAQRWH